MEGTSGCRVLHALPKAKRLQEKEEHTEKRFTAPVWLTSGEETQSSNKVTPSLYAPDYFCPKTVAKEDPPGSR